MAERKLYHSYPMHLERRMERLYARYVERLATRTIPKITKDFEKEWGHLAVTADSLQDDLDKLEKALRQKADPATGGKLVSFGGVMIPAYMRDEMVEIFGEISRWNYTKLRASVNRIKRANRMKRPGLMAISIPEDDPEIEAALMRATERNAQLIKTTREECLAGIATRTYEAVETGSSTKALARKLEKLTGTTEWRAKFWARDQVSKALGDYGRVRITGAGFPGYIWMTSLDARVRPDHAWRHGQYFVYGKTDKDPGSDYNCRCSAEPSLGPHEEISETQWRRDVGAMNRDRKAIATLRKKTPVLLNIPQLKEMKVEALR